MPQKIGHDVLGEPKASKVSKFNRFPLSVEHNVEEGLRGLSGVVFVHLNVFHGLVMSACKIEEGSGGVHIVP